MPRGQICSSARAAMALPLEWTAWLLWACEQTYCNLLSIFCITKWPRDQLPKVLHITWCCRHWIFPLHAAHCLSSASNHPDYKQLPWTSISPLMPRLQYCSIAAAPGTATFDETLSTAMVKFCTSIHRIPMLVWVLLFRKLIAAVLIGTYIHRVIVIVGYLYFQVYGMR